MSRISLPHFSTESSSSISPLSNRRRPLAASGGRGGGGRPDEGQEVVAGLMKAGRWRLASWWARRRRPALWSPGRQLLASRGPGRRRQVLGSRNLNSDLTVGLLVAGAVNGLDGRPLGGREQRGDRSQPLGCRGRGGWPLRGRGRPWSAS